MRQHATTPPGRPRGEPAARVVSDSQRRQVTVVAFASLGAYAFSLYALGPIITLLRDELRLSYATASLHSALWAAGTVATGLLFDRLTVRLGRWRLFWLASAGTMLGAALFVAGRTVALTLLAAAVAGTAGTFLQTATSAVLIDAWGERADHALVGANVVASAAAVAAPLVLAALAGRPDWRIGMLVPVVALAAVRLAFARRPLPAASSPAGRPPGTSLPSRFWTAATLVATVVGVELCLVFHGANLLRAHAGLSAAGAAAAMSVFPVAQLIGRAGGRRLTRTRGRAPALTAAGLAVTAAGFVVFWVTTSPVLATIGLGVAGLGAANLYPLTLSLAVAAAGGMTDAALARTQILVGSVVLAAPLLLGALADRVGVPRAYTVEIGLLLAAAGLLTVVGRNPAPSD